MPARPARGRRPGRAGGHGDKPLPTEVAAQIVAKTDGVPLFVEELTKTVLEIGPARGCRRPLRAVRPAAAARDPGDPARLADRPPRPSRPGQGGGADRRRDRPGVLPRAARRGRRPAASRNSGRPRPAGRLRAGLPPRHAARGHLHASSTPWSRTPPTVPCSSPGVNNCTPASRRCSKEQFPETAETQPELLAHHFTEAGFAEQAIDYWRRAGAPGRSRGRRMVEAIAQLSKGLDLLDERCQTRPNAIDKELDLRDALGRSARSPPRAGGCQRLSGAYARAWELCEQSGRSGRSSLPCCGAMSSITCVANPAGPSTWPSELLRSRERAGQSPAFRPSLLWARMLFSIGRFADATQHCERGHRLYDAVDDLGTRAPLARAEHPEWCAVFSWRGLCWLLGYPGSSLGERSKRRWPSATSSRHAYSPPSP